MRSCKIQLFLAYKSKLSKVFFLWQDVAELFVLVLKAPFLIVILHFDIDTYWIYTANYFREIIYHVYKSVLYIIARFFRFTYDTMKA